MGLTVFLLGVYTMWFVLIMKTNNLISVICFKLIPFFLGIGNILIALKLLGIISLNLK